MMNLLLKFHNSSLQRKYLDHLAQRSHHCILLLDLFIIADLIVLIIYLAKCASSAHGVYCLPNQENLFFAILGAIWLVLFTLMAFFMHFKRKTYSDILFLISYFYFLSMATGLLRNPDLSPGLSYIFTLTNLLFMTLYRVLFVKGIHLFGNLAYFIGFYRSIGYQDKEVIFLEIGIFSIFLLGVLYFIEKNEKTIFYNNFAFEREKRAFNELLDILPEGLAIFSKNMKEIFINGSMKLLYEETDSEKLLIKLFKETKKKPNSPLPEINPMNSNSEVSWELNQSFKNVAVKDVNLESVFQQFVKKLNERPSENPKDLKAKKDSTLLDSLSFAKTSSLIKTDSFPAEYQSKTFLIKILSIRFNSKESVLIIINDMTESVKLRALEEANDYKNNLFASFTHEFKTPLNCLLAMLHGISEDLEVSTIVKANFVKPAFYNCEILSNLVNAVSDYSLLSLGKMRLERKILNMRDFFERSLECLRYQAEKKHLIVSLEIDKELPEELKTDPRRLQQVLFQLYSNAIKFTYTGVIRIKVKPTKALRSGITISVKDTGIGIAEKDRLRLEASLNDQNNVFIAKSKTSQNSIGASLGLTVSQQIAKMLGFPKGKGISFKSTVGIGSKFGFVIKNSFRDYSKEGRTFSTIVLKESMMRNNGIYEEIESPLLNLATPEKKGSSTESLPKESEFFSSNHCNRKYGFKETPNLSSFDSGDQLKKIGDNNIKNQDYFIETFEREPIPRKNGDICDHEPILIVDDDEFNILALSSILSMKKIKSLSARNGQLALDLIKDECLKRKTCCQAFSMIFMDLNMPVMNGIETTVELKKLMKNGELPDIPIIAFTAFEMEIEKSQCFKAGMMEYLTKPLDIVRLGNLVEKYLGRK